MLDLASDRVEQALRLAAVAHRDQARRGSGVPYVAHPFAVARIVEAAGGSEDAVVAALLHDVVEDTDVPLAEVARRFGPAVAATVAECSEEKLDAEGRERSWEDRKRDHLAALGSAGPDARLVVLADKLHNLQSIRLDLAEGRAVWESFHAPRDRVLWYYDAVIRQLGTPSGAGGGCDAAIASLAATCSRELARVIAAGAKNAGFSPPEG